MNMKTFSGPVSQQLVTWKLGQTMSAIGLFIVELYVSSLANCKKFWEYRKLPMSVSCGDIKWHTEFPFSTYYLRSQACFFHHENTNSTQSFFSPLANQNSSVYGKPSCSNPHDFLQVFLGDELFLGDDLFQEPSFFPHQSKNKIFPLIHGHHAYSFWITQSWCIHCSPFCSPPGQTPRFCRIPHGK